MGNITDYLSKIKTAIYGKDVRGAMHDAIKQVYDDAAQSGNANMEVTLARGTEPNLNARLEKMDEVAETTTAELATKLSIINFEAYKTYLEARINALTSQWGKTYTTFTELNTELQENDGKLHAVDEDDNWYFWMDGFGWTSGGALNTALLADDSITPMKLIGSNVFNYFNPDTSRDGRLARASSFPSGGTIESADSSYCYSDFIPVNYNDVFTIRKAGSLNTSMVFLYDANKVVLSDIRNTVAWQTPFTFTINHANAKFMRVNLISNEVPKTSLMIVKGSTYPESYSPYLSSTLDWLLPNQKSIGSNHLSDALFNKTVKDIRKLYVPNKVFGIVNGEINMYFRSVVSAPNLENILYKSTYNDGRSKVRKDKFVFSSGLVASNSVDTVFIHDSKTGELIDSSVFTKVISDPSAKSNPSTQKNILLFGDSFTQAGVFSRELHDYLVTQKGWNNYNFIGRKTTYNVKHQGMGGYAIHDFVIPPSEMREGFAENPFYNPTTQKLDFKYYMSNNSFTGDIDYLILEHGVNDLLTYSRTGDQIVSDLKIFLNQLHIDYPNCKVLLCGLVHPSPINNFYGAYLQSERIHPINKAYDDFANDSSYSSFVTYVPVCIGFNVEYGYPFVMQSPYRYSTEQVKVLTDYLHPNESGYCMEADQIIAAFLSVI